MAENDVHQQRRNILVLTSQNTLAQGPDSASLPGMNNEPTVLHIAHEMQWPNNPYADPPSAAQEKPASASELI